MKALAILGNLILIAVCLMPIGKSIPMPFSRTDLLYHAASYLLITYLFIWAAFSPIKSMVFLITQGCLIEIIQPYFSRHFEFYDMIANTLGVLLGFSLYRIKATLTKKINTST